MDAAKSIAPIHHLETSPPAVGEAVSGWSPSLPFYNGWVLLVVLVSCIFIGINSAIKPLWIDELFTYYTAKTASIASLLHIQRTNPLAIEPPLYSLLAHFALVLSPGNHKVTRLPAAAGFLCFLLFSILFFRRLAGARMAIITSALLLSSPVLYYASEGRPYGALLGAWGASLLFWQSAGRSSRALTLIALAASIAIGINLHYFAVLMPLPMICAEMGSIFFFRHIRPKVLLAIAIGYCSGILWLPFLKGASSYSQSYGSTFHLSEVVHAYEYLLSPFDPSAHAIEFALLLGILSLTILGIVRLWQQRASSQAVILTEWFALVAAVFLPCMGGILAWRVHSTLEPRYTLYAFTGICGLAALGLNSLIVKRTIFCLTCCLILGLACAEESVVVRDGLRAATIEAQPIPAAMSEGPIVVADLGKFIALQETRPSPVWLYLYRRSTERAYTDEVYHTRATLSSMGLPVYDAAEFVHAHDHFKVAAWRDFDSWWFHSWDALHLQVQSVQKSGPWTIYDVSTTRDGVTQPVYP